MSDQYSPPPGQPDEGTTPLPPPYPVYNAPPPAPYGGGGAAMPQQGGPVGQVRGTGFAIALYIVTFGIYGIYWYYKTHQEMKEHSGQGLGGLVALLLALFVGIVMPYITSSEVGDLYTRRGQAPPVTAITGLWYFPGIFIIVGPIVWFVKTNGALNDYWRSLGATG